MGRKKVKLQYITNDATRRATYRKRCQGLVKKVSEIATLCDVEACVVTYQAGEETPEVWPSDQQAKQMLEAIKCLPGGHSHSNSKKKMNQEEFMCQRAKKLQEQILGAEQQNKELETTILMLHGLAGRSLLRDIRADEASSLSCLLEKWNKVVQERVDMAKTQSSMLSF